jgi:ribokinase
VKKPVVTVVGSFAVGLTMRTQRMPVFGETLVGSQFDMGPGGKGSNQAVAAARLGAESHFVGIIGSDALGKIARDLYAQEGVQADHLADTKTKPTGVGFIIVNPDGRNGIILDMGANELIDRQFVRNAEDVIARSDVVLAVLEIPLEAAAEAMALGRKNGVKTILNPAPAAPLPDEMLRVIDLITPNETELRILLGLAPDDAAPTRELALALQKKFGVTVIVTQGESGMTLIDGRGVSQFNAIPVEVVDTTGAGDAFTAALAVSLAEKRDLHAAIRFAGCNGALACTKYGVIPSLALRSDVDRLFSTHFGRNKAHAISGTAH